MKINGRWLGAVILLFFLSLLGGASNCWSQPELVTIGVAIPQQESPLYSVKLRNAYQVAVQEAVSRSTEDVRFSFAMIEYPSDPAKLKEALEQAIKTKKIKALVGGFSLADSRAIAEVAEKNSLPYLSIVFPAQSGKSEWIFHLQPPADLYVAALKGFAGEQLKAKSLAVLYEDSPLGVTLAKSIKDLAVKNSWSLMAFSAYPVGAVDFKGFFASLKNQTPDMLVIISSSADAIFILRQAQELNVNPKAFIGVGPAFGFHELTDPAMKQSEYLLVLGPWVGSSKPRSSVHFSRDYEGRFGYVPHQWEAMGYSAVRLMTDAVLKVESGSPKKIRDALLALKKDAPFGGEVRFGEAGGLLNQNRCESAVGQWQKGKLLIVYPDKYREAKPILPTPSWSERK